MGGSSSSSKATTNQSDNRRTIASNGISNEHGTVNVLDGGAIGGAFNFGAQSLSGMAGATQNALDFSADSQHSAYGFAGDAQANSYEFSKSTLSQSLGFASAAADRALDSLNTNSNLVKDAYADAKGRGALTDQILIGSIAMAGLVAVMALRK